MAHEYELSIMSESSWNGEAYHTFNMYFTEPEEEKPTPPGILLLIAGYGGGANSRIYRKMRLRFADEYNLYVVQCNYLGWEYMQIDKEMAESFSEFNFSHMEYGINRIELHRDLKETAEDYNEMGPLQAMDNILALKSLTDVLASNNKTFDRHRVACYGQSHGAYLGYLCNIFFPDLFTDIIDNSSYLVSAYLYKSRKTFIGAECEDAALEIIINYCYRIHYDAEDLEIYDLLKLYSKHNNTTEIAAFHGSSDVFHTVEEKKQLKDCIAHLTLYIIQDTDLDGEIFTSTDHGLDADFIKLFQHVLTSTNILQGKRKKGGNFDGNLVETREYQYQSTLIDGVPRLLRMKRCAEETK